MPVTDEHRTLEQLARLGAEALERHVRPNLGPGDEDKFVAVDVDSGASELDHDDYTAVARLRSRLPTAEVWLARVGQPAACRMRQSR